MGVHKRKKRLNQRYKQRERLKKKNRLWALLSVPMDGGAWWAAIHGVAKSRTRLSDFTFTFHFHALEKKMATHSSVLAWRIWWAAVYRVAESRTRLKRLSSSSSSSSLVILPPVPDKHHSAPQLYESSYCENLLSVEITPVVSFCDQFTPLSINDHSVHPCSSPKEISGMCFLHGLTCMEKNSSEIHPDHNTYLHTFSGT